MQASTKRYANARCFPSKGVQRFVVPWRKEQSLLSVKQSDG